MFQTVFDVSLLPGAWIQIRSPAPLETGLQFTAHLPIGIAKVQVRRRATRIQFGRPFQAV